MMQGKHPLTGEWVGPLKQVPPLTFEDRFEEAAEGATFDDGVEPEGPPEEDWELFQDPYEAHEPDAEVADEWFGDEGGLG